MGIRDDDLKKAEEEKEKMTHVEGGIEWNRSCTDVICCLVFIAFICAMLGVSGYALSSGDPYNIITPFDSDGNKCGEKGTDFELYPYKHFTNLLVNNGGADLYYSVCVSQCPSKMTDYNEFCKNNTDITSCNQLTVMYDTELEFGYCMPTKEDSAEAYKMIQEEINKQSSIGKYLVELQSCWQPVAIMSGMTILISMIYIWLLKYITKPLLYVSMLLILFCFLVLGAFCYTEMITYEKGSDNYNMALAGLCVSWGVGLAYLICICCCWNNIALGASIMECASEFVSSNIRVVALPIIAYILVIPVFILWTYCAIYLYSIGEAKYVENQFLATIEWKQETEYLFWAYFFGLLWVIAFIICVQQFMIAAGTCMWYFTGQGEKMSDSPYDVSFTKAFSWAMWYHCGSIAMGSFLIALITFIRVIFEYIIYQYEKVGNKENPVYKAFKCVARCILWMLDKYVKFITKNAYIQICLHNSSFCKAAWDSFCLVIRHAGRFSSATMIGSIMMLLGKGTIMSFSAALTYILIKYQYPEVSQPLVGSCIVAMVSYLVGSLFLSVFSFSCTALLHCFIMSEDQGLNANTPKSLEPFLELSDKQKANSKIKTKDQHDAEQEPKGDGEQKEGNAIE